jgi:LysR family hydrogen peroxide-inducible transcriptional activator
MMTITQLEYVIAVDTYKGFGEAAKRCFVTQPTLSMQIKKLEEEFGVLIFDRSKKPVLTTEIGHKIIRQAKIGLKEVKRIAEIIKNEKDTFSGTLRIGIIPTLSPYLVPRFAPKFARKYTDVNIVIEELLSNEIMRKLQNDQLDVGIMVHNESAQGLISSPMFYEAFLLYFSNNHELLNNETVNIDDLNPDEIWLLKEGHCFRDQIQIFCGNSFFMSKNHALEFESGSLETLRKIVESEVGFTLLPELAIDELPTEKRKNIRAFNKTSPVREISLVVHRSFLKQRLIEQLKVEIQAEIPKEMQDEKRGKVVKWI